MRRFRLFFQHEEAIQYAKQHFPPLCIYLNGVLLCNLCAVPDACTPPYAADLTTLFPPPAPWKDIKRLMGALLHRGYSLKQSQFAKYLGDGEW